jgi:dTDP-4-amino-4,6-dideoxygalactose transaminase
LKNFGFADELTVIGTGMNAKMNEIQAAFGLLNLKYVDSLIEKRKLISECYKNELHNIDGLKFLNSNSQVTQNHSYFPIFIDKNEFGISRDDLYEKLKLNNIYS